MNVLELLKNNPAVVSLNNNKQDIISSSLVEEALVIASSFNSNKRNIVVVKNNLFNANRLYELIKGLLPNDNIVLFAIEESLRIEAIASSPELAANKIEALNNLCLDKPTILITHAAGLVHYLPSKEYFNDCVIKLTNNQRITMEELATKLKTIGYEEVSRVDQPLTFAKRGGIVDVFSLNYDQPLRIEFFDIEIDSIRYFDLSSQRTIQQVNEVEIIPATSILFNDENIINIKEKVAERLENQKKVLDSNDYLELEENINRDLDYIANHVRENYLYRYFTYVKENHTILDYISNPLIILSNEEEINNSLRNNLEETVLYIQELASENKSLLSFKINADLYEVIANKNVRNVKTYISSAKDINSGITTVSLPELKTQVVVNEIKKIAKRKKVLLWVIESELKQLVEEFIIQNVEYSIVSEEDELTSDISICLKAYPEGFELNNEGIVVLTSKELFNLHHRTTRFSNKFKEAEVLSSYLDLQPGDYIVHNLYGIGQYLGIVTKEIDNKHKDFLNIAYKGDDVLLVPLEQFQLVRKFVSREGVTPKLNKLGGNEWRKTKENLQNNVNDIAERLINLYSQREELIGYAFKPDNQDQLDFEKEFSYELTPDQAIAIDEVKKDMESNKPMDRLLCGDVGFGKTEVAIRAAFKAISSNKQVAFLCPTTILSHQHYDTFMERFKNYPVNIVLLNRFVPENIQKECIQKINEGQVDIIIGTHRILSKDIRYKDLGLLIIDEEQRFGVEHKEKIKKYKQSIDVLSLSATPIPRTLQMSLIGIRSLSQLNTPPNNRMPVLTYVIEKNQSVIKEVIQRELVRNGQVFYLYNNIKDIYQVATKIQHDIPEAKVAVAHGQMRRQDIEDVMYQFVNNEYNVLICTTIIETGIDIPNANTMIVDGADKFGLSQLYQIKGRVGRSDRLAYAYLMYTPNKELTEVAQKRLTSIKEFTELGSGYKIAMRDLTIRGAGDLLGAKQSGFIDTVGIDMYIEMLNEAIQAKKGQVKEETEVDKPIPMELDAYIPEEFTSKDYEKITLYQRIEKAKSATKLNELENEIIDEYGKLPSSVSLLFEKKRLEILLKEKRVKSFKENPKDVVITFSEEYSSTVDGIKLFEITNKVSQECELKYIHGNIILRFTDKKNWLKDTLEVLRQTKEL